MSSMAHGERRWAATFGLPAIGFSLLGLCALSAHWTILLVQIGGEAMHIAALAPAMLVAICWSGGWALAVLGPRLFRVLPAPPRPLY